MSALMVLAVLLGGLIFFQRMKGNLLDFSVQIPKGATL